MHCSRCIPLIENQPHLYLLSPQDCTMTSERISTVEPTPLCPYYSILVVIFHNSRKSYSSRSSSCICNQLSFSPPFAFGCPRFKCRRTVPRIFNVQFLLPSRFTRSSKRNKRLDNSTHGSKMRQLREGSTWGKRTVVSLVQQASGGTSRKKPRHVYEPNLGWC